MHKKGFVACLLALALAAFPVFAGDAAAFQNLGFSADGRYFMFAQYGVSESGSLPYAQIFTVDVPRNRFVPGGTRKTTAKTVVEPGTDGRGALFNLLAEVLPLKKKYAIDHTRTGRLLYILMDGALPLPELEFRDFQADKEVQGGPQPVQRRVGLGHQGLVPSGDHRGGLFRQHPQLHGWRPGLLAGRRARVPHPPDPAGPR